MGVGSGRANRAMFRSICHDNRGMAAPQRRGVWQDSQACDKWVGVPPLAKDSGVTLYELVPADQSLESVFSYLVNR